MKTKTFIAGVLVVALFASADTVIPAPRIPLPSNAPIVLTATATNDLTSALQRGLFEEEGNRDLDAAISAYQSLAAQFDKSRQVAATAIFRLGECYRKLGRTNEAVAQYDRIVREFSDQQTLATLSRQNITGLSLKPEASGPVAASRIAQKRLLEEAIRLAEKDVSNAKKQFEVGIIPEGDVRASELEVLRLRNQMAGLDSGTDMTFIASPTARAKQRQLLEEEIKLVQTMIEDDEKRVKNGVIRPGDDSLYAARRELLSLQLQRVALSEEGAGTQANASGATLDNLQSQYALLKAQLEQARKETNSIFVGRLFDDQALIERATALSHVQENLNGAKARSEDTALMEKALSSMQQRVEQLRQQLFDYQEKRLDILQSAIQQARSGRSAQSPDGLAQSEAAVLNVQLRELKKMNRDQERIFVQQNFPNAVLTKLMQDLADAQQKLATLTGEFSAEHPSVQKQKELIAMINEQIHEQVEGVIAGLQIRLKAALREQLEQPNAASGAQESAVTDDEEKEIRRIQAMIQNSPDLVNSVGSAGSEAPPLFKAAWNGQLRVATFLLDHGANANRRFDGQTPLHGAARNGHKALADLFLNRGADVNAKDSTGRTALHWASQQGYQAVVETLLAHKPDVNAGDSGGSSALHLAAEQGNIAIVKMLVSAGANVNAEDTAGRTPLAYAARNSGTETVKTLLEAKADPNAGRLDAPLLCAINRKNIEEAELLLKAGANPNAISENDLNAGLFERRIFNPGAGKPTSATPLWLAAQQGQLGLVKLLLQFKADPNDTQTDGRAILFQALQNPEVLAALLDAGGNVEARVFSSNLPLLTAASWGNGPNPAVVELLLKRGANPNALDNNGDTPLHFVLKEGGSRNRQVIELLLASHADPNAQNKRGMTPLDEAKISYAQAMQMSSAEAADLLRAHGALDNLPKLDRIQVSRRSANFLNPVFIKGTNDWNQFTLLEAIAWAYGLISNQRSGGPWPVSWQYDEDQPRLSRSLAFPDFRRVIIHRPASGGINWTSIPVNAADLLSSGSDVLLHWGDVIEIPEADHAVTEQWHRLADPDMNNLSVLVSRTVTLAIHGTNVAFKLAPKYIEHPPNTSPVDKEARELVVGGAKMTGVSFMVRSVLDESKLIRFSSDLSRVKVTRRDSASGKTQSWTLDCSGEALPDLWLRDSDVIEVPEK